MDEGLFTFLKDFVSPNRLELFNRIIENRTRYITVVMEDIYQPHNASAVLRSCDCFGIQDVHIIENKNEYQVNPQVALGSSKWLNLNKYNSETHNTAGALNALKKAGYRLVATTPHTNDTLLEDFDLQKGKTALIFGTELEGLSPEAMDIADEYLKIPMYGFTESFNISVSAAIILNQLKSKLNRSDIEWQISEKEKIAIKINWLKQSIKNSEILVDRYIKQKNSRIS